MTNSPNNVLRATRLGLRMSQDEFANALQAKGRQIGEPNDISKRTVQRWENGQIRAPQPRYARALEALTGRPIELLGFPADVDAVVLEDGQGGHDLVVRGTSLPAGGSGAQGNYTGVWLSSYEYYSSSRSSAFIGQHHVVLLQHGDRLTVRSIPGSAESSMAMDLTVDRNIITGSWVEDTDPTGHYRGARYHGAIQMMAEPTGRRMTGKWVGFGKDMEINSGPWTLTFQVASTSKATIEEFSRPPGG